jgi:hypothetical protein
MFAHLLAHVTLPANTDFQPSKIRMANGHIRA